MRGRSPGLRHPVGQEAAHWDGDAGEAGERGRGGSGWAPCAQASPSLLRPGKLEAPPLPGAQAEGQIGGGRISAVCWRSLDVGQELQGRLESPSPGDVAEETIHPFQTESGGGGPRADGRAVAPESL